MKWQVVVCFTPADKGRILHKGSDWHEVKEKFNFWANEYCDTMIYIAIEVSPT